MVMVGDLPQCLNGDVGVHKYRLVQSSKLFQYPQFQNLAFPGNAVDPRQIFLGTSADEIMPVLKISGVVQVWELFSVRIREESVMIVLLAQDPVIFLSQKLYHSGLPGVCVSRNKISVAEMHPLAPRSLKCPGQPILLRIALMSIITMTAPAAIKITF